MTLASKVKKKPSRREQSERMKKLLERRRKKGLQKWVKVPKKENL